MSTESNRFSPSKRISKATALQAITGLVLLFALLFLGGYVVNKHIWAQAKLKEVGPRYERLLGIAQSGDAMHTAQAKSLELLELYAYPSAKEVNQVGTDVQQKLRTAFANTGAIIQSSQVMPEQVDGSLQLIPVDVRVEGNLQDLRDALAALSQQRPLVRMESIKLQRGRKENANIPVRINVQARFVAWRQVP